MMAPLVSVCMITFNHEKFIAEAIEGVLMQNVDFEIELVIADDCSTDGTGEVIQNYVDNHPKGNWIKYTKHQSNIGMMPNFFWALGNCHGKYIALCDGDDLWIDSTKLDRQVTALESKHDYVLSFHDCNVVDKNGEIVLFSRVPDFSKKDLSKKQIRYGSFIPTSTVFFRKIAIPHRFDFRLNKVYNGDTILLFFLSLKGLAHYEENFIASSYRRHSDGIWSSLDEKTRIGRSLMSYELLRQTLDFSHRKYLDEFLCFIYYELAKKESNRGYFIKSIRSAFWALDIRILLFSIFKFLTMK